MFSSCRWETRATRRAQSTGTDTPTGPDTPLRRSLLRTSTSRSPARAIAALATLPSTLSLLLLRRRAPGLAASRGPSRSAALARAALLSGGSGVEARAAGCAPGRSPQRLGVRPRAARLAQGVDPARAVTSAARALTPRQRLNELATCLGSMGNGPSGGFLSKGCVHRPSSKHCNSSSACKLRSRRNSSCGTSARVSSRCNHCSPRIRAACEARLNSASMRCSVLSNSTSNASGALAM